MERPKYIYVDFENVGMDGLQGAFRLSSEDKIFVFDSDKKKFNRVETDAAIECVSCVNGKKNIADFIMIGYFTKDYCLNAGYGYDIDFYLISEDKFFRRYITDGYFKKDFIDKNKIIANNIFVIDSLQNIFPLEDNKMSNNIAFIGINKKNQQKALQKYYIYMLFLKNNIIVSEAEVSKILNAINSSSSISSFMHWFENYLKNFSNNGKLIKFIIDKSVFLYKAKTLTLEEYNSFLCSCN